MSKEDKYLSSKRDELHHLNAIHKHLEYLKHMYSDGPLKDEHKLHYTTVGITNCNSEKKRVRKDIKDYDSTKK
jgi:hypothetical protein